ncbi:MAG: tRNA preQ1(34) S-adenosylmethionine ribosyltransferase-isomerase QueA [Desulfomonile tiedjei]|nr:tRNA preQ1(34) S-adenosylmethionine ribosyltransferase-isomerase QueA [Desulfomonile tiedjei]
MKIISRNQGESDPESTRNPIPAPYRLSTYRYQLPDNLIAQEPSRVRDASRLMVLHRNTGEVRHHSFRELPDLLLPSDLLVINETRVTPAALFGRKPSGGRVELLVLDPANRCNKSYSNGSACRECLTRSSKPIKPETRISLDNGPELTAAETVSPGRVQMIFPVPEEGLLGFLEKYGSPPLPPYISTDSRDLDRDRSRYQTVYARIAGSVAAPTAGLHFTENLLHDLSLKGIRVVPIILHVGPGTFVPVRNEDIRLHRMEPEFYEIPDQTAEAIQKALHEDRRVIAVGTTTVRALESAAALGKLPPGKGATELFLKPGYTFKAVQGLVTNFHLPGSTLLMLVCAFGGTEFVMSAYEEAVREEYRFYSYGDACLIVGNY